MKTKIYIINLDRAVDRYRTVHESLRGVSISVERIPGVDGKNLSDETFRDLTKKNRFWRPLIKTEVGCYLSHLNCLKKIIEEKLDFGIVLEDDAVIPPHFENVLKKILEDRAKNKTDWELLKLSDCGKHFLEKSKHANYALVECQPVPARFLAQVWTRFGAEKFLDCYAEIARPVDIDIKFVWEHKIRIENIFPDLVHHADTISTIGDRDKIPKPFLRRCFYQANVLLRRILWSIRVRGFRKTARLEFG